MSRQIKSKIVYRDKWVKLHQDFIHDKNGKTVNYTRITTRDFVEIVPVFADGSVLMLQNYRYGIDKNILELPAGHVEKNESPLKTARRELLEETGYSCGKLHSLGWYYYMPTRSNQKVYAFLATDLKLTTRQKLDSLEYIAINKLPRKTVSMKMRTGKIKNASVITALLLAGM